MAEVPVDVTTARTPEARCPYCDHLVDAASSLDKDFTPPKPGDLTVCFYCAQELVFDAMLIPRKPAAGELILAYAQQPGLIDEITAIKRMIRSADRR
jgi:hypothetical protein